MPVAELTGIDPGGHSGDQHRRRGFQPSPGRGPGPPGGGGGHAQHPPPRSVPVRTSGTRPPRSASGAGTQPPAAGLARRGAGGRGRGAGLRHGHRARGNRPHLHPALLYESSRLSTWGSLKRPPPGAEHGWPVPPPSRPRASATSASFGDMVTSPGGTSAEARAAREKCRFRTVLSDAVWAAYQPRCRGEAAREQGESSNPPLSKVHA